MPQPHRDPSTPSRRSRKRAGAEAPAVSDKSARRGLPGRRGSPRASEVSTRTGPAITSVVNERLATAIAALLPRLRAYCDALKLCTHQDRNGVIRVASIRRASDLTYSERAVVDPLRELAAARRAAVRPDYDSAEGAKWRAIDAALEAVAASSPRWSWDHRHPASPAWGTESPWAADEEERGLAFIARDQCHYRVDAELPDEDWIGRAHRAVSHLSLASSQGPLPRSEAAALALLQRLPPDPGGHPGALMSPEVAEKLGIGDDEARRILGELKARGLVDNKARIGYWAVPAPR